MIGITLKPRGLTCTSELRDNVDGQPPQIQFNNHIYDRHDTVDKLTAEVERLNYLVVNIGKRFDKEREHVKTLQKRLGRDNYGTQPAKPVVWVKKTETESRYGVCAVKCNEDGDKFYWDETCDIPLRAWQDIYKDIREVRVWTKTCETCGQAIESEGR